MSQFVSTRTMHYASSRQQSMWRRNQNTVKFNGRLSLGPVAHTVLVAIMLVILGLIYLTQVNKTGAYSYELDNLRKEQDSLVSQQQDLQVENARLQALERIKSSSVAQTMTPAAETEIATQ